MTIRYCYKCDSYTKHKDICLRCETLYEREIFYIVESIDFYGKIKNDFKKIKLKSLKKQKISENKKYLNSFLRRNEFIINSIYSFGKIFYEAIE